MIKTFTSKYTQELFVTGSSKKASTGYCPASVDYGLLLMRNYTMSIQNDTSALKYNGKAATRCLSFPF